MNYIKTFAIVILFILASAVESHAQQYELPKSAPIDYDCTYIFIPGQGGRTVCGPHID